ncbi:hypothetical protein [Desulfatibacillum aliphaticivorans]|uniref:hypothetical protein n=1 Tax=Desulfatibacillum aliphaticivorans TaxID=218208 RepID=UPI000408D12F|nr:hypothetical protein [Desulfatibacillum aliphaticivorans]
MHQEFEDHVNFLIKYAPVFLTGALLGILSTSLMLNPLSMGLILCSMIAGAIWFMANFYAWRIGSNFVSVIAFIFAFAAFQALPKAFYGDLTGWITTIHFLSIMFAVHSLLLLLFKGKV